MDALKAYLDERDELNLLIQAKIADRQELILKEHFEVVSLAPQTNRRANCSCATASEC